LIIEFTHKLPVSNKLVMGVENKAKVTQDLQVMTAPGRYKVLLKKSKIKLGTDYWT